MNTDKKENIEFPENVATTENEETDFTFFSFFAFANATLWIFVAGLVAILASFIFNQKKLEHLSLMLSTALNLIAGIH